PATSFLYVEKTFVPRLAETPVTQMVDQRGVTAGPRALRLSYAGLEENASYVLRVMSCGSAACVDWNASYATPAIGAADVTCSKILDNGRNKLDLIFVAADYGRGDLESGLFEYNAKEVLYGRDSLSPQPRRRQSFFSLSALAENTRKFNAYVVNGDLPGFSANQLASVARACLAPGESFDKRKDVVIVMNNSEAGMAYAQGLGTGFIVWLSKGGDDWKGKGALFAHELAHLIGFDEEYYFSSGMTDAQAEIRRNYAQEVGLPNCAYEEFSCDKWCRATRDDLAPLVTAAKEKYDECMSVFGAGDAGRWTSLCPALNFSHWYDEGRSFMGAGSQTELCALPPSALQAYVCYAGTLVPYENQDFGVDCPLGFGCYFGCGGYYKFMRSAYVSIMGGGALGEDNRIYAELDEASRVLPDWSPAAAAALREYLAGLE
ncbi:MAG: hypothetical protein AB1626_03795, partial [Candidatus Micrarchaeota archaeon]